MNRGFQVPQVDVEKGWFFKGANTQLKGLPLSDGHWLRFVPELEIQFQNGFDTNGCTEYGTLNALEILWKFLFGQVRNFAERFIAVLADNQVTGNDPEKVIETIRKSGLVDEIDLPFDGTITSWTLWKSPIPMLAALIRKGQDFLASWKIGHEWVAANPAAMKDALRYSPLGVSVHAWAQRADGLYWFPPGLPHNHWCAVVDYVDGQHWLVFDSYEGMKKVAWDATFIYVKRYAIYKNEDLSKFQEIINAIAKMIPLLSFLVKKKIEERQNGVVVPDEVLPPPVAVPAGPAPLVRAMILTESSDKFHPNGNDFAIGDKTLFNKAYGCLQIRKLVCDDVNRVYGLQRKAQDMLGQRALSIDTMEKYWSIWATPKHIGRPVTDEDRARIWNGGPNGWRNPKTVRYWNEVKKFLP